MAETYRDFFSDPAYETLSRKSAENLQAMLKGKSFMSAAMESQQLLFKVVQIEEPYRTELETLTEVIIKDSFPIVREMKIKFDLQIVESGDFNLDQTDKDLPNLNTIEDKTGINKRRIINSITQGAAIRGSKSFYLFKEYIDDMNPDLVEQYEKLLNLSYGLYDDDNAIAMMLAMMSQNNSAQGGESQADWNEETGELIIRARAVCFPILVHEAVKGLYEIISTHGFSKDVEKNKRIAQSVDRVQNEPEDLRYGKYIYDALNDLLRTYRPGEDITPLREYFLVEVYKLEDEDFVDFIDNLLAGRLPKSQRRWVEEIIKNL